MIKNFDQFNENLSTNKLLIVCLSPFGTSGPLAESSFLGVCHNLDEAKNICAGVASKINSATGYDAINLDNEEWEQYNKTSYVIHIPCDVNAEEYEDMCFYVTQQEEPYEVVRYL